MQRFISTSLIIALLGLIILWTGCGGGKQPGPTGEIKVDDTISVPDWFLNPPEDPDHLYAPATAAKKDMQLAINTAKHQGEVSITGQIETKVSGLFKNFMEEAGAGEDSELLALTTSASKAVISDSINFCKAAKQEVKKEGTLFRAYVLMEMPIGAASAAMMAQVKSNKHMYDRFRATQAFDELNEEVEKYEQFKKEQGR